MKPSEQYQQIGHQTDVMEANPHRLIQLLMNAVTERLKVAKAAIERKDYATKARLINNVISIIGSLRMSLNFDANSELCERLDALYDYMNNRLLEASALNDTAKVDEVAELMTSIKSAWDEIGSNGVVSGAAMEKGATA